MGSDAGPEYDARNRNRAGQWGKWRGVTCAADGCGAPAKCRGLCNSHYLKRKWASGYRPPSYNPEAARARHVKHRYGITAAEYAALLAAQGGRCAVCHATEAPTHWRNGLCVDHDHATGRVRGLLCNACNLAAGFVRSERGALALAEYFRVHDGPGT